MNKLLLPVLLLWVSCVNKPGEPDGVVARVFNDYLYETEIREFIPEGTLASDSIMLVRNYINNWILERLVLDKANKNLSAKDRDFKKQLERYENSLIIYSYETLLVKQKLDTSVTEAQIEEYYNQNIGNFQLKDNIVKVYFARFDAEDKYLTRIRKFFYSDVPEHRDSLTTYIERSSDFFFLNDESWILFDEVLRQVPINTYDKEAYLRDHHRIEITEEPYIYFIHLVDYMIKDGVSPLSFEQESIRKIIINQRRLKIINAMREEVFQAAVKNHVFEIY